MVSIGQIFYFDARDDPPRAAPFDPVPELFDAELFVPELFEAAELFAPELFEAEPPFFAAAVFPAAPPLDFAVDLDAAPFFGEAFADPVFAEVLLLAELEGPDLAPPDFAVEDLEAAVLAELDLAAVDFDPVVFDEPDFAPDDLPFEVFVDPEVFAPPFAAPDEELLREAALDDEPDVPATVSAAAPIAPTAAPCAAPLKMSPATSITASITFAVVDDCRVVLFRVPFELEDAARFELFCFVVFLSGMIFSLNRIEQNVRLKNYHTRI